jgi:Flp pilus assembly protein TadG
VTLFPRKTLQGLRARWRKDDGTASIEFVLMVPLLLAVFAASFESGLLMVRSLMLEQSLDITTRELRLGHYPNPSATLLKSEICRRAIILDNCESNIMIEMTRVSTTSWELPTSGTPCVDRTNAVQPVTTLEIGQKNDVMLMRVCVTQEAMFPTSGIALDLPLDGKGGYGLVAITAFVTEPI